jgi:predicted PurR-regulated permease PerM
METSDHNSRLSVSTGTIIRFFVVLIVIAALYYMSDILLVILAAVVIASSIEPVIRRLKRYHFHRIIAVICIYVIIAAVIAVVIIFFLPNVIRDTVGLLDTIPKTVSLDAITGTAISSHTVSISDLIYGLQDFLVGSSDSIVQTVSSLFGGLLGLILILVLSFYLAAQEEGVDDFLRIVTPVRHYDYIIDLWKRSQRKIGLWLQGQVILGIIVGLLVYVALIIVGIPHPLLLAVFAGVLEIIPVFGPIVSSVPAILLAFADRGTGIGFLIVYQSVYQ